MDGSESDSLGAGGKYCFLDLFLDLVCGASISSSNIAGGCGFTLSDMVWFVVRSRGCRSCCVGAS